jgi:hypothetical protein
MDDVREEARRLLVPELRLTRRPNMNMYNI